MKGLLFSQMEPAPADEIEFHAWYDHEHIPARMALEGFDSAVRYVQADGSDPWHLACYHLSDMAVLDSPAYQRLKADPGERTEHMLATVTTFTRYLCEQISDTGPVSEPHSRLFAVAFAVPDEHAEEFDAWYTQEHVPLLRKADGWLRVRRYGVRPGFAGPPWTRLALHELRSAAALDSPQRSAARDTDWRRRLAEHDWFAANARWVYRPIASAEATWR